MYGQCILPRKAGSFLRVIIKNIIQQLLQCHGFRPPEWVIRQLCWGSSLTRTLAFMDFIGRLDTG